MYIPLRTYDFQHYWAVDNDIILRERRTAKGYGVNHKEQQRSGHEHGKRVDQNIPHGGDRRGFTLSSGPAKTLFSCDPVHNIPGESKQRRCRNDCRTKRYGSFFPLQAEIRIHWHC